MASQSALAQITSTSTLLSEAASRDVLAELLADKRSLRFPVQVAWRYAFESHEPKPVGNLPLWHRPSARTPLALIVGPVEKLLNHRELNPEHRHDLEIVDRNARLLLKQVNDLLDVSKLEAGRMVLNYEQANLAQLIRLTAANFDGLAQEKIWEHPIFANIHPQRRSLGLHKQSLPTQANIKSAQADFVRVAATSVVRCCDEIGMLPKILPLPSMLQSPYLLKSMRRKSSGFSSISFPMRSNLPLQVAQFVARWKLIELRVLLAKVLQVRKLKLSEQFFQFEIVVRAFRLSYVKPSLSGLARVKAAPPVALVALG